MRTSLCLYIVLFFNLTVCAQQEHKSDTAQLFYRHFTVQDGLPSNEAYLAYQDKTGHMWICTDNGVSRFDGVHFKNYNSAEGLRSNVIFGCKEDPKGNLWMYSFSGELYRYQPSSDRFECPAFNDSLLRLLSGRAIQNLVFENDTMYVVTAGAYVKLVLKSDRYTDFTFVEGEPMTLAVKILSNGELVVINSTEENVTRFNFELSGPGSLHNESISNIPIYGLVQQQLSALKDGKDLYIVFGENMLSYNFRSRRYSTEVLPFSHIPALKKSSVGILSGSYGKGLWNLTKTGDHLSYKQLLKNKNISGCLEDNQGGIWACSQTDGLYFIPNRTTLSFSGSGNEASGRVTSMFTSGDRAYYMTYSGALYEVSSNGIPVQERLIEPGQYNMRSMKALNENEILLFAGRTLNYTISSGKIGGISQMEICARGRGASQSNVFAKRDKLFLKACEGSSMSETIISEHWNYGGICSELHQADGMWLGTINDLIYLNRASGGTSVVGKSKGMHKFSVEQMLSVGKDSVMVASNQGVFLIVKDEIKKSITTEEGLSSNKVHTLFLLEGDLWIGTSKGIDRIKNYKGEGKFEVISVTGLTGISKCPVTHLGCIGNYLVAGTDEGVYLFDRKTIFYKPFSITPVVKELIVNGTTRVTDFSERIKLSYNENSLDIEFSALNYRNSLFNKYRYRLRNTEKTNWTVTSENHVLLPSLSPGTYEFELQAMNPDGLWSERVSAFVLTVSKPFWQTWWFIILMVLTGGVAVYLLFLFRISQMQKVGDLTGKLSEAKMQTLGMQLNPHFMFNALHSISKQVAKNDPKATLKVLEQFAKLMRLVFRNSQYPVISLEDELKALNLYIELERVRLGKEFTCNINIDTVNVAECKVPALLLQPFVENAIWHGIEPLEAAGKLDIVFMRVGDTLQIEIIDNGVGRRAARQLKSKEDKRRHSIDIIKERLLLLRTKYNCYTHIEFTDAIEGKEICGTKVLLIIPWLSDSEKRGKDNLFKHFTLDNQSAYN